MGKKTVQTSVRKTYSDAEVLRLADKTFTRLEEDAENGCVHCIELLKEIFDNSKGTEPSNETRSPRFLAQNQPTQQTNRSRRVMKIGKVKNTSTTSY